MIPFPLLRHLRLLPRLPLLRLTAGLALAAWVAGSAASGLPQPVRAALESARIPQEAVSVWVQAVDAPAPSLEFNAARPMNPASVMKLVTAFAALEKLGPAYTWDTRIAIDGAIADGMLDGNLYITGGADPVLSVERLWKLMRQLRALGIERVGGDIVLDGSVLPLSDHDPHAFDGRGLRPYNSAGSGLLLHFNTLNLTLLPGATPGAPLTVAPLAPLDGLVIDNRLTTAAGACGTWFANLDARLEAATNERRLVLLGSMPASCGRRDWSAAPLAPGEFAAALVSALWRELGGTIGGSVRAGLTPPAARLVITDTSPPLADVLRDMNKWSSNVIARQVLATLGIGEAGAIDMLATGAAVAREQLRAAGIEVAGLVIENGAGLSRSERVRADTLGTMLLAAWQRPYMPEFIAALPVAGLDGTARRRLAGSPARGQAHVKTGTINEVRSIAGYVLDRHGRRHAVVMMVSHPQAANSQAAQDALLEWVWAGGQP